MTADSMESLERSFEELSRTALKVKSDRDALLKACEVFIEAEDEWIDAQGGMPEGTFDDPLGEAYKLAKAAIAEAKR